MDRIRLLAELLPNYAGLSDAEICQALNAQTISYEVDTLATGQIYNCVNPTEFNALTADKKQLLRDILSLGEVDVSAGTNARAVLLNLFPAGTATINALAAAVTKTTSLGNQNGIGNVSGQDVREAREVTL